MSFDYNAFATKLGLSAEDKTALDAIFTRYPTASTEIDGFITQQVTERMTPLTTDLERKQRDLDAQFETLATIRGGDSEALDAAHKRIEAAQAQVTIARERIRRLATETGQDPETYLKDIDAPPAVKPEPKPDGTMVDPKAIAQAMGQSSWNAFTSSLEMEDLADKHRALFGTPLSRVELANALREKHQRTGNANFRMEDVWREKYNVGAKEAEIAETKVQARIADAVAKARQEEADKVALGSITRTQEQAFVGTPIAAVMPKEHATTTIHGVPEGVAAAIKTYADIRSKQTAA